MKRDQIAGLIAIVVTAVANVPWLGWISSADSLFPSAESARLESRQIPISFIWSGPGTDASGSEPALAVLALAVTAALVIAMFLHPLPRRIVFGACGVVAIAIVVTLYLQLSSVASDLDLSASAFSFLGIGAFVFAAGGVISIVAAAVGAGTTTVDRHANVPAGSAFETAPPPIVAPNAVAYSNAPTQYQPPQPAQPAPADPYAQPPPVDPYAGSAWSDQAPTPYEPDERREDRPDGEAS